MSHVSKDHVNNYNPRQNNRNNADIGPNANLAGVNNASMNNEPHHVPPSTCVTVDDEADEITFVGGWVAAVYDPEASLLSHLDIEDTNVNNEGENMNLNNKGDEYESTNDTNVDICSNDSEEHNDHTTTD